MVMMLRMFPDVSLLCLGWDRRYVSSQILSVNSFTRHIPYTLPRHLYLSLCFSNKCPPNLYHDTLYSPPDTCISACVSVSALQTYTMTPYTLLRHLYLSLCLGNMCPPNLYPMLSTRHLYLSLCLGNKCPPNLYPEPYALPRHLYLSLCLGNKCPPILYPEPYALHQTPVSQPVSREYVPSKPIP